MSIPAPVPKPGKTRVLVVDDSALVRGLLAEIINRQSDMQCVGTAPDPLAARELIRQLNPDVITLDVEMPRMDGLAFLSHLMRLRPMPVVMVSTLTERGAEVTLRALELGAVDFVAKPRVGDADLADAAKGLQRLADDITDKLRTAAKAQVRRRGASTASAQPTLSIQHPAPANLNQAAREHIIFIGASTGGTEATRELLSQLPADGPAVMVAQHMPPGFTRSYAQRLDGQCRLHVKEAVDGERVLPGHAYIAAGGLHLTVERAGPHCIARVRDGEPVNRHKPSIDVLFESAARVVGRHALGVMLTGMGADGARAMKAMRDAGSYNICQDEASCVVFGMPREAIAQGAAHAVLPLGRIGPALVERLRASAGAALRRV